MIIPLILFVIGLALLLKGASVAVRGAEGLALRFGVSPATIGLTIIAFGTSLPELVVTTEAFARGDAGIGFGNIVGSNIANIGLILGLIALFHPITCCNTPSRSYVIRTSLMVLGATAVFVLFSLRGMLDTIAGIVFLGVFFAILFSLWRSDPPSMPVPDESVSYPLLLTGAGLAAVIIGAHLLLTGAVEIALTFGISSLVIGLSMVAIGTSLPELATSVVAAVKKSPGVAMGNILGSNIFNLLFIGGINSLWATIPVPGSASLAALCLFSLAMFTLLTGRPAVTRVAGVALLSGYIITIALLFLVS